MSFGFGGGSGGQIRYTISVDDSQAIQKLQSVGQQMQSLGTSVVGSQQDVTNAMQEQGQAVSEATKAHESYGSTLKQNVLGIALAASSIISLVQQYTSLKRAQNTLEKAQNVEKGQVIAIAKQRLKLAEAVKKHGENSKEARAELEKLNLLESKHATQIERIDLMQQSLSSRMADFAVNIVPSVIGIVSGLTQTFDILGKGRTGRGGIAGTLLSLGKFALPLAAIGFAAFAVKTNLFGFRDALDGVGAAIGKAIPGIKPFLDAIRNVGVVLGLVPGDAKKAQAELKNFAGGIIAWGQDIIKQVSAVFDKLKSGDIVGAITDVKKMAVNAFKSIGVDIRKEVAKFKKDPIQYVTDIAVDLLHKLGDITVNGITLRQWKAALPILIKTEIADAKGNVLVGLGNVVVDIANATIGPDATKKIQDALANLRTTILTSTHKSAVTLASPMKRGVMYDFLDALIPGVGTQVQNWVSTAIGNFKVAWKQFIISIKNFIVGMPVTGINFAASILKATTDLESQFINWFATNLAPPIGKAWATLVKTVQGFFETNPILKDIGSRVNQILGTASLAVNDIIGWISNNITIPIIKAWTTVTKSFSNFFTKNPILTAGKNLLDQILGTINFAAGEAKAWFQKNILLPIQKEWNNFADDLKKKSFGVLDIGHITLVPSDVEVQLNKTPTQKALDDWAAKELANLSMTIPSVTINPKGYKVNKIDDIPGTFGCGALGGGTFGGCELLPMTVPSVTVKPQKVSVQTDATTQFGFQNISTDGGGGGLSVAASIQASKLIQIAAQQAQTALANLANQGRNSIKILSNAAKSGFNTVANYAKGASPSLQKLQTGLANLGNQGANSVKILAKAAKTDFNTVANYAKGATPSLQKLQTALANLSNEGVKSMNALAKASSKNFNAVAKNAQTAQRALISLIKTIGNMKSKTITVTTNHVETFKTVRLQHGFHGMVNSPMQFMAGEAGPEYVSVTPMKQAAATTSHQGGIGMVGAGNIIVELTNVLADREIVRTYKRKLGEAQFRFGPR